MIGNAQELVDDPMLLFGNDPLIRTPAIDIERGVLPVALGYGLPQSFSTLTISASTWNAIICRLLTSRAVHIHCLLAFLPTKLSISSISDSNIIEDQFLRFGFDLEVQVIR